MTEQTEVSLIVGLGNPGPRYEQTRHNAGFWFVDALAREFGVTWTEQPKHKGWTARASTGGHEVWLLKPSTFMNLSGESVAALAGFFKIPAEQILVAHDELDLPPGTVRLKRGGGHGGHNGLRSLVEHLGSRQFLRLRLGIGHPGHRDDVVDYVLTRPSAEDRTAVERAVADAVEVMPQVLAGDLQRAMTALHSQRD